MAIKMRIGEACLATGVELARNLEVPFHVGRNNWRVLPRADFLELRKAAGLEELYLRADDELVRQGPVCIALLPSHLETVRRSTLGYQGEQAVRLQWLQWWMEWALKNCDEPVIAIE